jgi:plastocyanin
VPVTGAPPTPVDGQPAAAGVTITALNIEFTPQAVTVPAGQPFTIELVNRDEGIPHDIQVTDPGGNILVKSEIITGPARLTVGVPALAPGTYTFSCIVHPNMTGTITAE